MLDGGDDATEGLAVSVVRGLGVGVGADVGVGVLAGVEPCVLVEAELLAGIDVLGGSGVDVGVGLADRLVDGAVIEGAVDDGVKRTDVAAGTGAEVVDDGDIAVGVPAVPLQPARITVRAASPHPNRIRTAAG